MSKDTKKSEQATKRLSSKDIKKESKKKSSKPVKGSKKIKFKDEHPRAATAIKISIIAIIVLCIIGAGVLVGVFYGAFGSELKIDEKDLVIKYQNSTV